MIESFMEFSKAIMNSYVGRGVAILLILWAYKKMNGSEKEKDWLTKAQERQQKRYDYTDPVKPAKQKQPGNRKWTSDGWYYDEDKKRWIGPDYEPDWQYNSKSRMWVDADQMDSVKAQQAYEANRKKWEMLREEEEKLEALKTPIHLTQEEKDLSKHIQVDRSQPSFEEWKAQQKRDKQN